MRERFQLHDRYIALLDVGVRLVLVTSLPTIASSSESATYQNPPFLLRYRSLCTPGPRPRPPLPQLYAWYLLRRNTRSVPMRAMAIPTGAPLEICSLTEALCIAILEAVSSRPFLCNCTAGDRRSPVGSTSSPHASAAYPKSCRRV